MRVNRDSIRKERVDFKSQLEATISKLGNLKLIAQDKENEFFSEWEKTKKVEEKVSILKGTMKSTSYQMSELKKY